MLPAYLNQTVREIHTFSRDGTPVFYEDNRLEESVILSGMTVDPGKYLWTIPNLTVFQAMDAVWYGSVGKYAEERNPRVAMLPNLMNPSDPYYWYRSGPQIAFSTPGLDGQEILLSYFAYPRSLPYFAGGTSPILFNRFTFAYEVNPKYTGPTLTYDQAMAVSTNWVLQRHEDSIKEGVRAKAWKRVDDMNRAKLSYSTFETMKTAIQQSAQTRYVARYGS
jgi:hypothetical protein